MRFTLTKIATLSIILIGTPAGAITRNQAVAQCRAMHANPEGMKRADRSGVSIAQQIKRCVQRKMRATKGR